MRTGQQHTMADIPADLSVQGVSFTRACSLSLMGKLESNFYVTRNFLAYSMLIMLSRSHRTQGGTNKTGQLLNLNQRGEYLLNAYE